MLGSECTYRISRRYHRSVAAWSITFVLFLITAADDTAVEVIYTVIITPVPNANKNEPKTQNEQKTQQQTR